MTVGVAQPLEETHKANTHAQEVIGVIDGLSITQVFHTSAVTDATSSGVVVSTHLYNCTIVLVADWFTATDHSRDVNTLYRTLSCASLLSFEYRSHISVYQAVVVIRSLSVVVAVKIETRTRSHTLGLSELKSTEYAVLLLFHVTAHT